MRLCVIGSGYVGLVSGTCFADVGNNVCCVDKNPTKVEMLRKGQMPIYEPGLDDVVLRCQNEGRLTFSTDLSEGIKDAQVCFITVDTPPDGDGRADLRNVLAVAEAIGKILTHKMIVVTKSTVPVGTTQRVKDVIAKELRTRGLSPDDLLAVASNPEFLKEGDAINDFMKPDRVVVGVENDEVGKVLHEVYKPFIRRDDRFIQVSIPSSELIKYAANSMLATRISFMNEMSRLCDKVGADVEDIRRGLGSDPRIGPAFLYAGLGYGGSCFPKDTKAIIELGKDYSEPLSVIEAVDKANDTQREWFWNKIVKSFGGEVNLKNRSFAVWGVSFKPDTDDVRYAPSIYLITKLLENGANVTAFDPVATETGKEALGNNAHKVKFAEHAYACVEGADALIVCTDWREFKSPDFAKLKSLMSSHSIFDGRNLYSGEVVRSSGFEYTCIGRQS